MIGHIFALEEGQAQQNSITYSFIFVNYIFVCLFSYLPFFVVDSDSPQCESELTMWCVVCVYTV